jgi:DNA-binding transcriptional LysR family regulator
MKPLSLASIDTNLLVALNLLLEERSVSRAARRMNVSQPAMSQTLQRLRELFEDPLLVRSGREMIPTPYARGLARRLHVLLGELEALIREKPVFDPGTARTLFTIAGLDYISALYLPDLLADLQEQAPGVDLVMRPLDKDTISAELAGGVVDAAIGLFAADVLNIETETLFTERFRCLVRADHPILSKDKIKPEEYAAWPHGLIDPRGNRSGIVDTRLKELGLERRVIISLPYFLSAADLVTNSDLIFTLPARMAEHVAQRRGLATFDPPLKLPTFPIRLGWHTRLDAEPGNLWLRESIRRVMAQPARVLAS